MISLERLRQRKLFQWAAAYLAAAWVVLQLIDVVGGYYSWPSLVGKLATVMLVAGLFATLVAAWYHGEKGEQRVRGPELLMLAGILLIAGGVLVAMTRRNATTSDRRAAPEAVAVEQGSIAVLPFADMSPQKDQAYFSDGLSDELLNALAQIPELRVAARTSSFSFRDSKVSIDSIARALHVAYVLEGSVRTVAERVRITAQLVKAKTGYHVWSNTYDRHLKDVFAVQDEISRAIVAALQLKIGGGRETLALVQAGTNDPEAHALVLKGSFELSKRTAQGLTQAQRFFEQAIRRDPNYAKAHALLAYAHQYTAYRRFGPSAPNYEQATRFAERALKLDPKSAEANVVLGRVKDVHEWRFGEAEAHFARAVELNPGLADAHRFRAMVLMRLGRSKESIAAAERAVLLDPVSAAANNSLGTMYSYARDYARSKSVYQDALAVNSQNQVTLVNLALTAVAMGQLDEALRYVQDAVRIDANDQYTQSTFGYVQARSGRRAEAEASLRTLRALENPSPYLTAVVHAALGDRDGAFNELERAVAEHDDQIVDLGVDDVFDSLRNDARMTRLLKQIGLPDPRAATPIR